VSHVCWSFGQFFDKKAPRLPDVDVRPPTPEPEPEPEVFLGDEWEGRLRRLQDLWSIEPDPQEALVPTPRKHITRHVYF
jgi:hypothetical protein